MKAKEIQSTFHEFLNWLKEILPDGKKLDDFFEFKNQSLVGVPRLSIHLKVGAGKYSIMVEPPSYAYTKGSMGCVVIESNEKQYDLTHGIYSYKTWRQILRQIMKNELLVKEA